MGILAVSACEKEIAYDWPETEPKLSMFGVISPTDSQKVVFPNDSIWWYSTVNHIEIGQTSSLFNVQEQRFLYDAKVVSYENGTFKDSLEEVLYAGLFEAKNFEIGKSYTIRASKTGFKEIEATVLVPDTVVIISPEFNKSDRTLTFSFNDPIGLNFYSFNISADGFPLTFYTNNKEIETFQYMRFDTILIPSPGEYVTSGFTGYLKDNSFDGTTKKIEITLGNYLELLNEDITITLSAINYDYYEFFRTYAAYFATKDNPFAENVQVHSNVNNGVGLLGTQSSTHKIAIKK